jgi:putative ATPase
MTVFAAEDIGNADPRALQVAVAATEAFRFLGQPEGEIPLTQAVVYLATAPKSNASYMALQAARAEVRQTGSLPVPMVIRNAPTKLMKELGYGSGYQYDHDTPDHFAPQEYLPEGVGNRVFYKPGQFGFERDIAARMAWWDERRRENREKNDEGPTEDTIKKTAPKNVATKKNDGEVGKTKKNGTKREKG